MACLNFQVRPSFVIFKQPGVAWCGWIGCSLSFFTSVETSPLFRSLEEAGHPALKPLKDKKFAMSARCLSHNPHDVQKLHQHRKQNKTQLLSPCSRLCAGTFLIIPLVPKWTTSMLL